MFKKKRNKVRVWSRRGSSLSRATLAALMALAFLATALVAQEGETLTLRDALELAKANNPNFQAQRNDQAAADWQVREAYGAFLPTANVSSSFSYTEAGVQRIGTLDFGQQSTDWLSSNYSLNLNWALNGQTLFGVSNARASSEATAARISAAEFTLESAVTLQYMTTLRAIDAAGVARRQRDRARRNLDLVRVRVAARAAAGIDAKQAEVDLGRAEVALIQAEVAVRAERLRLAESLGVRLDPDVQLVSEFEMFDPDWTLDELRAFALERHPSLRAFEAQERSQKAVMRQSRSQYFPTISLSTRFSGNALEALNDDFLVGSAQSSRQSAFETCTQWHSIQSQLGVQFPGIPNDCGAPQLSQEQVDEIVNANSVFPFDYTKNPVSVTFAVSVPVFTGFTRQRSIEQAEAAAKDAEHNRRAEELRLETAVTEGYDLLIAATDVVDIEERNVEVAGERLDLARQRYQLGAADIIELLDAETSMTTAERDYLNAVYQFHQALVVLENATGRTLRPGAQLEEDPEDAQR